jgi:hypothetical protein
LQRIRDCGAADWLEVVYETVRTFAVIGICGYQLAEKRLSFGGEPDDLEPIVGVKIFHAEPQRFLRLDKFGAGHRTGRVYDKYDVLGCRLCFAANRRSSQEQKVSVVTVWFVSD